MELKTIYLVWINKPTRLIVGCFEDEAMAHKYLGDCDGFVEPMPVELSTSVKDNVDEEII